MRRNFHDGVVQVTDLDDTLDALGEDAEEEEPRYAHLDGLSPEQIVMVFQIVEWAIGKAARPGAAQQQ